MERTLGSDTTSAAGTTLLARRCRRPPLRRPRRVRLARQPRARSRSMGSVTGLGIPLAGDVRRELNRARTPEQKYAYGHGALIPLILLAGSYR